LAYAKQRAMKQRRVQAGETNAEAKQRWAREAALQDDYDNDPRRIDGRILPVRYD
jgi:hypothetical protein